MQGRGGGRGAQSLSHVLSSKICARRAVDSVGLRSLLDLLTCASGAVPAGTAASGRINGSMDDKKLKTNDL